MFLPYFPVHEGGQRADGDSCTGADLAVAPQEVASRDGGERDLAVDALARHLAGLIACVGIGGGHVVGRILTLFS